MRLKIALGIAFTLIALVLVACVSAQTQAPTTQPPTDETPTDETPTTDPATDCLLAKSFIEVKPHVENSEYPDPELSVSCSETTMTVKSNDIPNFEFVDVSPHPLEAQDFNFDIPLIPAERSVPGAIGIGPIGITVTGLSINGAFEAPFTGYQDPYLDPAGVLDYCNGHPGGQNDYHVHAQFACIFEQTGQDPNEVGLVYGYIFDGYELVSPYLTETTKAQSSYVRIDNSSIAAFEAWEYQAGSGDLDECNGKTDADGVYRYYITDSFPYLPFCFHGETDAAQGDFTGNAPEDTGPPGGPPQGNGQRLDFAKAALELGVSEAALQTALSGPRPNFEAAAKTLGLSLEDLRAVLPAPPQ